MPSRFQQFGNDLFTGARSIDFVGRRRLWLGISAVLMVVCILVPIVGGGFNWGIDFRGGSQFEVSHTKSTNQNIAIAAVHDVKSDAVVQTTVVNGDGVRVTTDQLTTNQTKKVTQELADGYKVDEDDITSSYIGPAWGQDVSRKALQGLGVFLILAFIGMALYFRTWKMSLAAIITLFHDLIFTAGVYALTGFEITPATVIGFLTILGYSLYDTVVVFDKVRENTGEDKSRLSRTFGESVNLAVNQTLVRSINTAVIAALPVAGILFIGSFVLGAATLEDISLSLFVGILIGTYSSVFVAAPLYAWLRENEPEIAKHDRRVRSARAKAPVDAESAAVTR
ncbi:protein translocase subunit SecF [Gryllotalpicola ginsengisoli]|uniref:protein translocase subunit SecF n=1 Tax=Gryllotalpicola ginsengisoli TaxID=444608 RepID=UPI0003B3E8A0|nr:protein translocase subunit SecF [Gryllotalpicola ginsengisoli]